MIVAAGLIGISQARLPRPVRDYHDRVNVEMSAITLHDTIADWLGARSGAHPSAADNWLIFECWVRDPFGHATIKFAVMHAALFAAVATCSRIHENAVP